MSPSRKSRRSPLMGNHQRSWIWGRHAVLEALRAARWNPTEVRWSDDLPRETADEVARLAARLGIPAPHEPAERLRELCKSREHQGLIARMPAYPYLDAREFLEAMPASPCLLVLDSIQDAFNFGAMLRCAEVFGVDAVVVGAAGQCDVTSQVVRSSAGAAHHVPIVRCESFTEFLRELAARGVRVVAASEKAEQSLDCADFRGPTALVIGNEGEGIAPERLALCDETVSIPQRGRVGSLNAAVAAGVLLYEVARQRAAAKHS